MDITRLYEVMGRLIGNTPMGFTRYKSDETNWNARMTGIVGPRGVGKTTMMLQHIKRCLSESDTLYVAGDNMFFADHTMVELADHFVKQGGKHLFIDEVHKYANWSRELKQIYDSYPDLQVVFTGSSVLDIYKGQADLSRRAPIVEMQGLSFREYLKLFHGIDAGVYSLQAILNHEVRLEGIDHPLPYFHDYLRRGYYPFGMEDDFSLKMQQVVGQTLESDIPQYADLGASTARKLKHLLAIVAQSAPFKPVMQTLAEIIGVSRNNVADYLVYIERAGMIGQLRDATGGIRGLGKVEKLYLDNTNLMFALTGEQTDVGSVRETFFYNQMRVRNEVVASKASDFEIGGLTFEVGGKSKGKRQLAGIAGGYVVKDDIERGHGNIVPLWHFGLNY